MKDMKVLAYYFAGEGERREMEGLRFSILTHVNYAFAIPTEEGRLHPLAHPEQAKEFVRMAHDNNAVAMIAVGGWSYLGERLESVFARATDTPEKRKQLAEDIEALCDVYGFDGIDIDWEYPKLENGIAQQYEALMVDLAKRLHAKDRYLTAAVYAGLTAEGEIHEVSAAQTDRVLEVVDWINVMTYDGGDEADHSPYELATGCGAYWTETRGVPAKKVLLGVPFYGRPAPARYRDILAQDPEAWNKDTTVFNGRQVWYNGCETIRRKAAYAKEKLGGVMIWEIGEDTPDPEKSLLSAVAEGLGIR